MLLVTSEHRQKNKFSRSRHWKWPQLADDDFPLSSEKDQQAKTQKTQVWPQKAERSPYGIIYEMKYSWKSHKDRNRDKNRIKKRGKVKVQDAYGSTCTLTPPPLATMQTIVYHTTSLCMQNVWYNLRWLFVTVWVHAEADHIISASDPAWQHPPSGHTNCLQQADTNMHFRWLWSVAVALVVIVQCLVVPVSASLKEMDEFAFNSWIRGDPPANILVLLCKSEFLQQSPRQKLRGVCPLCPCFIVPQSHCIPIPVLFHPIALPSYCPGPIMPPSYCGPMPLQVRVKELGHNGMGEQWDSGTMGQKHNGDRVAMGQRCNGTGAGTAPNCSPSAEKTKRQSKAFSFLSWFF